MAYETYQPRPGGGRRHGIHRMVRMHLDVERNPVLFERYMKWFWGGGKGPGPKEIAAEAGISTSQLRRVIRRCWFLIETELADPIAKAHAVIEAYPNKAAQLARRAAVRHWKG